LQQQFTLLPWCCGKKLHFLFAQPWKGDIIIIHYYFINLFLFLFFILKSIYYLLISPLPDGIV